MQNSIKALKYVTLDVFTAIPFGGNPLAIVKLPQALFLFQEQKQKIANEFNYSETVFLHEKAEDAADDASEWLIDIFTTTEEIPFAGHPTIGTACHVLAARASAIISEQSEIITATLVTKAGRIWVEYDIAQRLASAVVPHNIHLHGHSVSHEDLIRVHPELAIGPDENEFPTSEDVEYPVVSIVKGMTFVLVRLKDERTLSSMIPSVCPKVTLDDGWTPSLVGFYYYTIPRTTGGTSHIRARMVHDGLEDAATGSAACALASHLSLQRDECQTWIYAITQGVEKGRASEIGVKVNMAPEGGIAEVVLSGSAVQMMEGTLASTFEQ
jgi:PhzF family phenazine biosynthesis protein